MGAYDQLLAVTEARMKLAQEAADRMAQQVSESARNTLGAAESDELRGALANAPDATERVKQLVAEAKKTLESLDAEKAARDKMFESFAEGLAKLRERSKA